MKNYFTLLVLILFISACKNEQSKQENTINVHKRIAMFEDSIKQWGGGLGTKTDILNFSNHYIETLLEAYETEPENPNSPMYLDRIHMWYVTTNRPQEALKWAKVLIEKYPNYSNRKMVLESVAGLYDFDVKPRDSSMVRKYYTQLLDEFPNLKKDKKEAITKRLKYNQLEFEAYILKVN